MITTMKKLYLISAVTLALGMTAQAQTVNIDFEQDGQYRSLGVYDMWEESPFRKSVLTGNWGVCDNPDKSVDPVIQAPRNDSEKVIALQRSRFGSNAFGLRIDLNEPFRLTKDLQYIHVAAYLKDKPAASRMMVIGLGKRVEEAWNWQTQEVEQFYSLTPLPVKPEEGWQDIVVSVKGWSYAKDDAENQGKGIDIYSLVIVPDVRSAHGDAADWVAYFDNILVDRNSSPRFFTEKYALTFDKAVQNTRQDRNFNGVGLTFNGKNQTHANTGKALYKEDVTKAVFSVKAGATVTPTVSYQGAYMNAYTYVDWLNKGGFTSTINADGTPADASDVVSYTGVRIDGKWKNSKGEDRPNGNNIGSAMPNFTVPASTASGMYRMRYKVDWDDISSAGSPTIKDDGGGIIDVMLNVYNEGDKVKVGAGQLNGDIYLAATGEHLSNYMADYEEAIKIKIVPENGFVQNGFTLRYGYNVNSPVQLDDNGNPNWIEVVVPATAVSGIDGTVTIPTEYIRGTEVVIKGDMQQAVTYTVRIVGAPDGEGGLSYCGVAYTDGQTFQSSQYFKADDVEVTPVSTGLAGVVSVNAETKVVTVTYMKALTQITSLDQLSNAKVYQIKSKNNEGYWVWNESITNDYVSIRGVVNAQNGWPADETVKAKYKEEVSPFDNTTVWQITKSAGSYYIYQPACKKYVTRVDDDYKMVSTKTPIDGFKVNDDGTFSIHAGGGMDDNSKKYACIRTDFSPNAIRVWTWNDHATPVYIIENPNISLGDPVSVTYNFIFDGENKGTETVETVKNAGWPDPTTLPEYTSYTLPEGFVTEDATKDLVITATTPFEASKSFASAQKWYNLKIKGASYWSVDDDASTISLSGDKPATDANNAKWAFVGNPFDGYIIYNGIDRDKVLSTPINIADGKSGGNTFPFVQALDEKTDEQNNEWVVYKSTHQTNGFFVGQKGYTTSKLNVRDGKLAYWNGGADNGSTVNAEEVEAPVFEDDPDTGISQTEATGIGAAKVYDLAGRKLASLPAKGVVIADGKKVIR